MTTQQVTSTRQMDFSFETHGFGAAAIAAKRIANNETIYFDVFTRPNKDNYTELHYKARFYFGLLNIEDTPALRVSHCPDLYANESNSLIASWNNQANDPVFIAARLTLFLSREGSDFFIQDTQIL